MQILALSKRKTGLQDTLNNGENLSLTVGLFCTWALSYEDFADFLRERITLTDIVKVDVPLPPAYMFEIHTASGQISIPLDEIRWFIRPACTYCLDITAEFSDISVGTAEGIDGWNTVIVRSEKRDALLKKAADSNRLEANVLPEKNLEHLNRSSPLTQ